MNTILKIEKDNEKKEMLFELKYQMSLTIGQRFKMMLKKSEEMRKLLEKSGHRKDAQVIKRTEGSGRPQEIEEFFLRNIKKLKTKKLQE